jgi:hypothetical protein
MIHLSISNQKSLVLSKIEKTDRFFVQILIFEIFEKFWKLNDFFIGRFFWFINQFLVSFLFKI